MFKINFFIVNFLVLAGLLSGKTAVVDAVQCLACSSYSSGCGTEPCNGPCFTRTDPNGIVYRGCTSGFWFSPALTPTETCRYANGAYWCLCNSDRCNIASCSSCSTNPVTSTLYCLSNLDCFNGGYCLRLSSSVSVCSCQPGYTGNRCETRLFL